MTGQSRLPTRVMDVPRGFAERALQSGSRAMAESHPFDAKTNDLLSAVGDVLTRWARLEFVLAMTFQAATRLPLKMVAAILIKIKTFSLTLDIVDSVVKRRLSDIEESTGQRQKQLVFWNSLIEYVRELSGDRNFLAHTAVVIFGPGNNNQSGPDWNKAEPFIGPSPIPIIAGQMKNFRVGVIEAKEIALDIQETIQMLQDFAKTLETDTISQDRFFKPITRRRPRRADRQKAEPRPGRRPPRTAGTRTT